MPIKVPQGANNLIQWLKWLETCKDTCKHTTTTKQENIFMLSDCTTRSEPIKYKTGKHIYVQWLHDQIRAYQIQNRKTYLCSVTARPDQSLSNTKQENIFMFSDCTTRSEPIKYKTGKHIYVQWLHGQIRAYQIQNRKTYLCSVTARPDQSLSNTKQENIFMFSDCTARSEPIKYKTGKHIYVQWLHDQIRAYQIQNRKTYLCWVTARPDQSLSNTKQENIFMLSDCTARSEPIKYKTGKHIYVQWLHDQIRAYQIQNRKTYLCWVTARPDQSLSNTKQENIFMFSDCTTRSEPIKYKTGKHIYVEWLHDQIRAYQIQNRKTYLCSVTARPDQSLSNTKQENIFMFSDCTARSEPIKYKTGKHIYVQWLHGQIRAYQIQNRKTYLCSVTARPDQSLSNTKQENIFMLSDCTTRSEPIKYKTGKHIYVEWLHDQIRAYQIQNRKTYLCSVTARPDQSLSNTKQENIFMFSDCTTRSEPIKYKTGKHIYVEWLHDQIRAYQIQNRKTYLCWVTARPDQSLSNTKQENIFMLSDCTTRSEPIKYKTGKHIYVEWLHDQIRAYQIQNRKTYLCSVTARPDQSLSNTKQENIFMLSDCTTRSEPIKYKTGKHIYVQWLHGQIRAYQIQNRKTYLCWVTARPDQSLSNTKQENIFMLSDCTTRSEPIKYKTGKHIYVQWLHDQIRAYQIQNRKTYLCSVTARPDQSLSNTKQENIFMFSDCTARSEPIKYKTGKHIYVEWLHDQIRAYQIQNRKTYLCSVTARPDQSLSNTKQENIFMFSDCTTRSEPIKYKTGKHIYVQWLHDQIRAYQIQNRKTYLCSVTARPDQSLSNTKQENIFMFSDCTTRSEPIKYKTGKHIYVQWLHGQIRAYQIQP